MSMSDLEEVSLSSENPGFETVWSRRRSARPASIQRRASPLIALAALAGSALFVHEARAISGVRLFAAPARETLAGPAGGVSPVSPRTLPGTSTVALAAGAGQAAASQPSARSAPGTTTKPPRSRATATFAGGCFWCVETAFEGLSGVLSVTSGYAGGAAKDPSYEQVSSGSTGHAESVQVVYDPTKIAYDQLLVVFWRSVDPLQKDGQFCDHGPQYRSAIFYHDEDQRKAAEDSKRRLEEEPRFKGRIATQIAPAMMFYPAEEYHQDFYKKNPKRYQEYRLGCGRDARLQELWGMDAGGRH